MPRYSSISRPNRKKNNFIRTSFSKYDLIQLRSNSQIFYCGIWDDLPEKLTDCKFVTRFIDRTDVLHIDAKYKSKNNTECASRIFLRFAICSGSTISNGSITDS